MTKLKLGLYFENQICILTHVFKPLNGNIPCLELFSFVKIKISFYLLYVGCYL